MKRVLPISSLLAAVAALLFSADITGTWKGQLVGADRDRELTFDFAVKGEALSGTVTAWPTILLKSKPASLRERP